MAIVSTTAEIESDRLESKAIEFNSCNKYRKCFRTVTTHSKHFWYIEMDDSFVRGSKVEKIKLLVYLGICLDAKIFNDCTGYRKYVF